MYELLYAKFTPTAGLVQTLHNRGHLFANVSTDTVVMNGVVLRSFDHQVLVISFSFNHDESAKHNKPLILYTSCHTFFYYFLTFAQVHIFFAQKRRGSCRPNGIRPNGFAQVESPKCFRPSGIRPYAPTPTRHDTMNGGYRCFGMM